MKQDKRRGLTPDRIGAGTGRLLCGTCGAGGRKRLGRQRRNQYFPVEPFRGSIRKGEALRQMPTM